jgi:putative transposase
VVGLWLSFAKSLAGYENQQLHTFLSPTSAITVAHGSLLPTLVGHVAAMDFFTVPTATFSILSCFFVIGHERRRILQQNVTRHPTSAWIVQQLREAFPYQSPVPHL